MLLRYRRLVYACPSFCIIQANPPAVAPTHVIFRAAIAVASCTMVFTTVAAVVSLLNGCAHRGRPTRKIVLSGVWARFFDFALLTCLASTSFCFATEHHLPAWIAPVWSGTVALCYGPWLQSDLGSEVAYGIWQKVKLILE
jgi:hypothetical protein